MPDNVPQRMSGNLSGVGWIYSIYIYIYTFISVVGLLYLKLIYPVKFYAETGGLKVYVN